MYRIIKALDGKFKASCMYQDGTDNWTSVSKEDAIKEMILAAKSWNHATITEEDIKFGEEIQVIVTEIKWQSKKCCSCKIHENGSVS